MGKHTQGPWAYDKEGCRIVSRDLQPDWAQGDPDFADTRVSIVELHGALGGTDADLALMVASPELLASLKALVRLIENTGLLIADDKAHAAYETAKAAIAKAEEDIR